MSAETDKFQSRSSESIFFKVADLAATVTENIDRHIDIERSKFEYVNLAQFPHFKETGSSEGNLLKIQLNLPHFEEFEGVAKPKIFVIGTPENEAVSLGRLALNDRDELFFQLSRFHYGHAALEDMSIGMNQALYVKEIGDLFALNNPEKDSFIIHITREGPMIRFESSLYNFLRKDIPYTSAHSRHIKVDDPGNEFGRIADVCDINFEGLIPSEARLITICDNTASGMQHVAVLDKTIQHIEKNNGKHDIRTLLIISPLLTAYGATTISYAAASYGIRTVFACSAHLLGCIGPKRYYSPILNNENLSASPQFLNVNSFMHQGHAEERCARGNWTSTFSAKDYALLTSDDELGRSGTSNAELIERGNRIDLKTLEDMGINPFDLIPYSTLDEARERGILKSLSQKIAGRHIPA
jgi:hypothetical protein